MKVIGKVDTKGGAVNPGDTDSTQPRANGGDGRREEGGGKKEREQKQYEAGVPHPPAHPDPPQDRD